MANPWPFAIFEKKKPPPNLPGAAPYYDVRWLRGADSNRRPLGYEPNELPLLHPATFALQPNPAAFLDRKDFRVIQDPKCGSSPRSISTAQLNPLRGLHLRPIKPVVYGRPYSFRRIGGWEI